MAKSFRVRDVSGRDFPPTKHNQEEVFELIDATSDDKSLIADLDVGDVCNDFRGLIIERIK